jgi:hypothetical protein
VPRSEPPALVTAPIRAENVADWKGADVLDPEGEKLGKLAEVFYDGETDVASFVAIKSGRFGKHLTLVPIDEASVGPNHLRVGHRKEELKRAPTYETDAELTVQGEAETFAFYGLSYTTTQQGARRLAKR